MMCKMEKKIAETNYQYKKKVWAAHVASDSTAK